MRTHPPGNGCEEDKGRALTTSHNLSWNSRSRGESRLSGGAPHPQTAGSKHSRLLSQKEEPVTPKSIFEGSTERTLELGKGTETMPHTRAFPSHALRGTAGTPPAPPSSVNGLRKRRALRPTLLSRFTGSRGTGCEPRTLLTGETPRTEPSPCLKKRTFWWDRQSPPKTKSR